MTATRALNREQVLAHRRRVGALEARLPGDGDPLREAAALPLPGLRNRITVRWDH